MPVTLARPRPAASSLTASTISPVAGDMNDTPAASATAILGSGVTVNPVSPPSAIAVSIASR